MYKNFENKNDKFAKENKLAPLAPVILGLVPRIFWQQGTDLVNKLALLLNKYWGRGFNVFSTSVCSVILRRYSLLEVPWRRIHNIIAKAMSICVAYGNKVMDTRLPQPAGCGDKYDVCCVGRSMIEMLGVLAIIGVLSVGGIAGYSKAMEKFKINKVIEQYSMMTYGILEHLDDFKKSQIVTIDTLQALNIIPQSWIHNTDVIDDFNNKINLYIRKYGARNDFIIDIYLSGVSPNANNGIFYQNFSKRICVELFQNLFLPLHTNAVHAEVYRSSGNYYSFAGDTFCTSANAGPTKCMTDVTLDDIHKACDSCDKTDESCNVNIHF